MAAGRRGGGVAAACAAALALIGCATRDTSPCIEPTVSRTSFDPIDAGASDVPACDAEVARGVPGDGSLPLQPGSTHGPDGSVGPCSTEGDPDAGSPAMCGGAYHRGCYDADSGVTTVYEVSVTWSHDGRSGEGTLLVTQSTPLPFVPLCRSAFRAHFSN